MKLKTVEVNGKTYAEIKDNLPIFVTDDGKEQTVDVAATLGQNRQLAGEAKAHRTRAEEAEAKLKPYENIDPEAATKALETVKNLKDGELITAGKAKEVADAAKKAAEESVAAANKANTEKLQMAEKERDTLRQALHGEKKGNAFATSQFVKDKLILSGDLVKKIFDDRFEVEQDGKIIGKNPDGTKVFSRKKPGEVAEFEEALELLVESHPQKNDFIKGDNRRGDGKQPNGPSIGADGKKTMPRAAFAALPADQQMALMRPADPSQAVQVVD